MTAVAAPGGDVEMAAASSSPAKGPATTTATATTQGTDIDDFDLPRTVINRIAKTCFPEGTALAKETRLALTKSATVFINYITGAAGDACKAQNKKTISVEHIYKALEESEFEGILEYVKEMVQIHKQVEKQKRQDYRMKKTATPVAAPNAQQGDDQVEEDEGSASSVAQQIPSKRVLPMENNSPLGNTRVGQGMSMDVDPSSFAATREPTADSAHKKTKVDSTHSMAPSSVSSATSSPFKTTSIAALVNPTEDEEEE